MKRVNEILSGWLNLIFKKPDVEVLANERKAKCDECLFKVTQLGTDVCSLCHCPLKAKQRSPKSKCELKHWKR